MFCTRFCCIFRHVKCACGLSRPWLYHLIAVFIFRPIGAWSGVPLLGLVPAFRVLTCRAQYLLELLVILPGKPRPLPVSHVSQLSRFLVQSIKRDVQERPGFDSLIFTDQEWRDHNHICLGLYRSTGCKTARDPDKPCNLLDVLLHIHVWLLPLLMRSLFATLSITVA
jgi:hypothetical protein